MKQLTRCGVLAAATIASAALFASPASATETARTHDCVTIPEFNMPLGDVHHSFRRDKVEQVWGVRPVGGPNDYWLPANTKRWYSIAYHACGTDKVVAVVYRVNGDAWQYAVKGALLPGDATQPETGEPVSGRS